MDRPGVGVIQLSEIGVLGVSLLQIFLQLSHALLPWLEERGLIRKLASCCLKLLGEVDVAMC